MNQDANEQAQGHILNEVKLPYDAPQVDTIDDARAMVTLATASNCGVVEAEGPEVDGCNFLS